MRFIHHFPFILGILCGCSEHAPLIEPVEVSVPVPIPCVSKQVNVPKWNIQQLTEDASAMDKLKAALGDLELSRGYISQLEAELSACS